MRRIAGCCVSVRAKLVVTRAVVASCGLLPPYSRAGGNLPSRVRLAARWRGLASLVPVDARVSGHGVELGRARWAAVRALTGSARTEADAVGHHNRHPRESGGLAPGAWGWRMRCRPPPRRVIDSCFRRKDGSGLAERLPIKARPVSDTREPVESGRGNHNCGVRPPFDRLRVSGHNHPARAGLVDKRRPLRGTARRWTAAAWPR